MQKITFFTASLLDNNYLDGEVENFCLKSWERLPKLSTKDIQVDYKIFTYKDPEVIEFMKECGYKYKLPGYIEVMSDAFRFYILSKYPYHFWLDADVYIGKDFKLNNFDIQSIYLTNKFWLMYNSSNIDLFKEIYIKCYLYSSSLLTEKSNANSYIYI